MARCQSAQARCQSAHAPGPRGSPQVPQAPGPGATEGAGRSGVRVGDAKVENCFSASSAWQAGQVGASEPKTSSSKGWSQARQTYWKIGTGRV